MLHNMYLACWCALSVCPIAVDWLVTSLLSSCHLKVFLSAVRGNCLRGDEIVSPRRKNVTSAEGKVFVSNEWGGWVVALWGEKILFLTFVRRDLAVRAFFYIFAPKCMHYEQY